MSESGERSQQVTLHVPIEHVFEAFTVPSRLAAWSDLSATISARLGGAYTLRTPDGKLHDGTIETYALPEQLKVSWPDWNLDLCLQSELGGTVLKMQVEPDSPWHDTLAALERYFQRPVGP
jgi:uncharacterized protein YndB with AHSA1/START domain